MLLQLANAELGLLDTILDGGLPVALLIAVYVIFSLYRKEKDAKDAEVAARVKSVEDHATVVSELKSAYSVKVEKLLRERIESETASQKIIIEAKEIMQSVIMQMGTISDLIEAAERES